MLTIKEFCEKYEYSEDKLRSHILCGHLEAMDDDLVDEESYFALVKKLRSPELKEARKEVLSNLLDYEEDI